MPRTLNVSLDLKLPADAITRTFAILAMIGAGKSNAGAVFGEEFYAAGLPFVAIDPKGDWWGLRSSGDGTGPGLPILIFGGLHGDLPLHEDMGKLIADLIVDQNLTCILDVSEFPSKAAQMRFLTDFAEHLYRRHGREPQARHLIMEEADEYLPQVVRADEAKCVGVWTRIAKRGRPRTGTAAAGKQGTSRPAATTPTGYSRTPGNECSQRFATKINGQPGTGALPRALEDVKKVLTGLARATRRSAWECAPVPPTTGRTPWEPPKPLSPAPRSLQTSKIVRGTRHFAVLQAPGVEVVEAGSQLVHATLAIAAPPMRCAAKLGQRMGVGGGPTRSPVLPLAGGERRALRRSVRGRPS